jgi:hypothetical protein
MFFLLLSIILEFLLSQLLYEFVPRLDLLSIVTLNIINPLGLFALGLIKDLINLQVLGFSSLLYLLLSILYCHYRFKPILSLISIFFVQWIIDVVMFSGYQQLLRDFITNCTVTLVILQCLRFRNLKVAQKYI